jgi:transcriptional regulator with XRE-family HTH domain
MFDAETPIPIPTRAGRRRRNRQTFLQTVQRSKEENPFPPVDVGERLRELRSERGLSLRALAELSGLNVNTLSMIENGKTSPSVSTLQQLSNALGIPISAFFETKEPRKRIVFQQADQRPRLVFALGALEDLGAGLDVRGAKPFLVHLEPLSESGPETVVHTGLEFVFCLEGSLTYTIEGATYLLSPGDSLMFEAHLPHRWQNTGNKPSRSLLVMCPSDENDQPTERHFSATGVD